jgi:hypothetical protein
MPRKEGLRVGQRMSNLLCQSVGMNQTISAVAYNHRESADMLGAKCEKAVNNNGVCCQQ